MAKKKPDEPKKGAPEWMNTYGDMVTLLLTFFILLFSMSSVDAKKFSGMVAALQGSLGVLDGGTVMENSVMENVQLQSNLESSISEDKDFEKLATDIKEYLNQNGMNNNISVMNENSGLVLRFKDNILFDSGKSEIRAEAYKTLNDMSAMLNKEEFKDKMIRVEGHTDNDPIRTGRFPSNWELSTSRSSNVVRFMIEQSGLSPNRLSASGYGEYHPVAPNDSQINKSKNRRVDILILKDGIIEKK